MPNITEIRAEIQQELDELMGQIEPLQNALAALDKPSNGMAPAPAADAPEGAPAAPQTRPRAGGRRLSGISDEAIIDVVKANPNCGAAKIREILPGISSNAMSMRLTRIVNNGDLIRMGERRNTHYRVPAGAAA